MFHVLFQAFIILGNCMLATVVLMVTTGVLIVMVVLVQVSYCCKDEFALFLTILSGSRIFTVNFNANICKETNIK